MKKNEKSSGFAVISTLFLLLFIAELFFCTWCRVECRDFHYEIRRQEAERERLLKDRNRLNVEIERLKSPERIGADCQGETRAATAEFRAGDCACHENRETKYRQKKGAGKKAG